MAKTRGVERVHLLGVTGRSRSDLLRGTALQAVTMFVLSLPAAAQLSPNARPVGETVVGGSATIARTATTTTINQASQRTAIDWRGFDVGSKQLVTFAQPSANAVALNRVTGPDPSRIAGSIQANGQIVLVNQAGVTFFKGAQVNAQSFIVTTSNIPPANFMAGGMTFEPGRHPNARIVNRGEITVKQAGLAALVAPRVANSGTINARLGHVVLAGAKSATLDLYGDGLLSLDVTNQITQAPTGRNGAKVEALVTNSGIISADGGTVQLTAAAADGVLQNLVRAGGKIAANTVGGQTGTVTVAGIGGSVSVTGVISAAGRAQDTMGGAVAVNATGNVVLANTARINASGQRGGGTVALGTTLQRARGGPGTASAMTATNVGVSKSARVTANATRAGNGGNVTVLSNNVTRMDGTISATGGKQGGDGGFVEVSGQRLGLSGLVNVLAPAGNRGTILLDPTDLAIVASGNTTPSSVDSEFTGNTLAFAAADGAPLPSTVSVFTIQNLGTFGNVVIQATNSIDVRAPISMPFNGLTLQSGGNLTIETGASITAAQVLLQAGAIQPGGALVINADIVSNATVTSQLITLKSGTGGIALNGNLFSDRVDLNATGGGITQTAGVAINAGTIQSTNGVTGTVSLLGANVVNNIDTFAVASQSATPSDFLLKNTTSLLVAGPLSATGNVYLQTSDPSGIAVGFTGALNTGAASRASFQTDAFAIVARGTVGGSVTTGTFELAPNTIGQTVNLGTVGATLSLASLNNIASTAVRIGAVTQPGIPAPVTTAGAIAVGGTFDVLNRNLDLNASGAITQAAASPLINVATLSGTAAAWSLPLTTNAIAAIGNLGASSFSLNDSVALTVAGTLASTGFVSIIDTGTLTVSGAVIGSSIGLTAGDIAIPGQVKGTGLVDLIANVGTISETGTLVAGTLVGTAVGVADLSGASASANQVATLATTGTFTPAGAFTASNVVLRDGIGLTVDGTVLATAAVGQVFLESTALAGITITAAGSVSANAAAGTVSLQTDGLANNGSVSAATFEVAPATSGGLVTLGATGSGLSLASMTGITTGNVVIGAVTLPNGGGTSTTAGAITVAGAFDLTGVSTLRLTAVASAAPGATGAITQSASLTGGMQLGVFGNSVALTTAGNAFSQVAGTASTGDLAVRSDLAFNIGPVSAPVGNVWLASAAAGGETLVGSVTAAGVAGLQADAFNFVAGSVTAGTVEIAPFTAGTSMTLGSSAGGLSLPTMAFISAGTTRFGAITPPGGSTPVTTAGALTIAGTFSAATTALLELDAAAVGGGTGAITQSAPLINVAFLAATGSSVILTNVANQIATGAGITATAGDIALIDGTSLILNGVYSGNNLFFEVARAGGSLIIGGASAATLTTQAGGRASLVADSLTANVTGSIGGPGGTVELAPFSAIPVSLAGSGGRGVMLIDAGLLASIDVGTGTLVVGGFSNPPGGAAGFTTTAAAISLDGAVNLAGRAGTLLLGANGPVTEPGGPLTVGTVTGTSVGDFSLGNAANNIQASTGITAAGGDVFLADDPTLLLTGLYSGNNLYFHVALAGGSIGIGDVSNPATLVAAPGGTISLVADGIAATSASTITAPGGTLEVAPFSAINESVAGASSAGQLLVDGTLLADITGGGKGLATLLIGEYTTPRVAAPTISAASITIDGALDLTGRATNLGLIANGPVTQRGGPITASNVFGQSVGNFALTNPANAISQYHSVAAVGGDAILVSGADLSLSGTQSGNNVFIEVARGGGTLSFGAGGTPDVLTTASGGRISLIADRMTQSGGNSIAAPGGTLELAPFSAINASLLGTAAGQLNIGQPLLSGIVPGLAMLEIGGFTNIPGGAAVSAPSAASISVDGAVTIGSLASILNFQAIGAVTQVAPIVNVATLVGTTGRTTLDNANNTVATLGDYTARNGFALTNARDLLIAGNVIAGPSATFAVAGALTETGGITAGALSGSAAVTASFTGNNTIAGLNGFSVSGAASAFSLNDRVDLLITRTLSANRITISDPASRITLGDGAAIVTGGSVRPANSQSAFALLPSNGGPGALLQSAQFSQTGRSTVNGLTGPATLQVSVTGDIQFDTQAGLVGPATWLALSMIGGNATGNVAVSALDISYRFPGGANLFGSIGGVAGPTAASLGFIQAQPDPRFLFNNCEIGIVSCGLVSNPPQQQPPSSLTPQPPTSLTQLQPPTNLTVVYVPIDALLALVSPALVLDPDDNDNLLQMPVVSKEDY